MNILITSVGRRGYLVEYFKQALNGRGKVYVANSSDINPSFSYADGSVVTPLIYSDEYIPFLLNYCKNNQIDVIISLFDVDLLVLAEHRNEFNEIGVNVIVSDKEFIKICNDKWLTYEFLNENGFNTPKTFLKLDEAIDSVKCHNINFPLIVKPRWGMGSLSIYMADNISELKSFYKKTKKEILNSYMKYESLVDINSSVLIQEKINGQEYGLDVINDLQGNYVNTICKKKIAMRSGETDCAKIVDSQILKTIGLQLSKITKHIANLDVDVFMCDQKVYILEMNARFGGGYPFSHLAGVNLPLAIVKWNLNEAFDKKILFEKKYVIGHKDINIIEINNN